MAGTRCVPEAESKVWMLEMYVFIAGGEKMLRRMESLSTPN